MKTSYVDINPYTTRDASEIRELMHPQLHGNQRQSLAEALIPAGERPSGSELPIAFRGGMHGVRALCWPLLVCVRPAGAVLQAKGDVREILTGN